MVDRPEVGGRSLVAKEEKQEELGCERKRSKVGGAWLRKRALEGGRSLVAKEEKEELGCESERSKVDGTGCLFSRLLIIALNGLCVL